MKRTLRIGTKFIQIPYVTRVVAQPGSTLAYDEEWQKPYAEVYFIGGGECLYVFDEEARKAGFAGVDDLIHRICVLAEALA